ncbi:MAG TPA: hypothetical protein VEH52_07940 [Gaiellaceae bacterium]|nr:hypothetical protein [Gaiellaceae bacterium]
MSRPTLVSFGLAGGLAIVLALFAPSIGATPTRTRGFGVRLNRLERRVTTLEYEVTALQERQPKVETIQDSAYLPAGDATTLFTDACPQNTTLVGGGFATDDPHIVVTQSSAVDVRVPFPPGTPAPPLLPPPPLPVAWVIQAHNTGSETVAVVAEEFCLSD